MMKNFKKYFTTFILSIFTFTSVLAIPLASSQLNENPANYVPNISSKVITKNTNNITDNYNDRDYNKPNYYDHFNEGNYHYPTYEQSASDDFILFSFIIAFLALFTKMLTA